ncbi:DUF4129 domain-containing protein [Chloroflexota bacterium]
MKPNWRRVILYLTTMGVEGCWLYALFFMLNGLAAKGGLSTIGLLLLYPLAFAINKLLVWVGWHRAYRLLANVAAWAIFMLLMVKVQLFANLGLADPAWLLAVPRAVSTLLFAFDPALLILLGSILLWWLGWRLAGMQINFARSITEFQFGLLILVIVLLVAPQLEIHLEHSVLVALVFFFFALLGLSVAHAEEGTGWLAGLYQGNWFGILLICISVILVLGLIIGSVITPDFIQLILTALKWVWGMVEKAITYLVNLFPVSDSSAEPLPELMPAAPAAEEPEWHKLFQIPEAVRNGMRLGWSMMMLGLILFFLWRVSSPLFSWLLHKLSATANTEFEPLSGAFKADILALFRHLYFKLRSLGLLLRWRRKSAPTDITSVRQIYRQLLRWAASRGVPKLVFQTPDEYRYVLQEVIPESGDALRFITQHYVSSRYGSSFPSDMELHQLKQSWHQIKHVRFKRPNREDKRVK